MNTTRNYHRQQIHPHPSYYPQTLRNPLDVNYHRLSEIRVTPYSSTPNPNANYRQQPPQSPYMIDGHAIICITEGNTSSTSRNQQQHNAEGVTVLNALTTGGLRKRQQQIIHRNLIPLIRRRCCKDDDEDEDCSICLCEMEENTKLVELTCKHTYHVNCIGQWLERQNFCPLCKRPAFKL